MTRRNDLLTITLVLTVLGLFIATNRPIDYAFDPRMFVEHGQRYAETWRFFSSGIYDQSPPLRYVPYAILFALFDPSYSGAFRIATYYAAIVTFVGGGISSYVLGTTIKNRRMGWFAVGVFVTTALLWPGSRFTSGKWQYTTVFPLVLLSLATAERAVQIDDRRYAYYTGILLGVAGLQQLTYAGLASIAIGLGLAARQKWRVLTTTGFVGATLGSLLLLGQPEAKSRATAGVIDKLLPDSGGILHSLPDFVNIVLAPGIVLLVGLVLSYSAVRLIDDRITSESFALEMFYILLAVGWAISKLTRIGDYLAVTVRFPLVFVVLFGLGIHLFTDLDRDAWMRLPLYRRNPDKN